MAAVQWLSAAERQDLLDRWCSTVGAPITFGAPAVDEAAALDSLAILTWNTHVGAGDLEALVTDLRVGRLTGGAPVRSFVILLQEVYRAGGTVPDRVVTDAVPSRVAPEERTGRGDIVQTARDLGLSLAYVPSMRNGLTDDGLPEDRGNAIVSTLPLEEVTAIELPFEAQRRVAVSATVRGLTTRGRDWKLRVSSVHFDTRSTGSRFLATFGAGRLRQARGLVARLPPGIPTVVGGDLNTWTPRILEGSLDYLQRAFPDSPCPSEEPTFQTGWGFTRRLDHFFFRLPDAWQARFERVDDRYESDHYPLLAWVGMTPARPGPASPAPERAGRCT